MPPGGGDVREEDADGALEPSTDNRGAAAVHAIIQF